MSGVQQQGLGINDDRTIASVEEFEFEPIKGYPMLQWHGKRPFHSTRFYPAQLKEVHGPEVEGWRNKIYWGDNLQVMSHLLKQFRGQVKLVYIDPPFDSKADYTRKISVRGETVENEYNVFEEKQYTDIWTNDEYLQFIYERLILVQALLHPAGTVYVHIDASRGHHIRCIMDEIFGPNYFRNEVIWYYENKLGTGGQTLDGRHDNLLVYTKSKRWTHNPLMVPVKKQKPQPVTQKIDGKRIWLTDDDGNRIYENSSTDRPLGDVWPIPIINPVASERLGYPTQKPEQLLKSVISQSSNPGDLVFDCFMGSGTTQAVAMTLGRRFIGADINLGAVQITTKRLLQVVEDLAIKKPNTQKSQQEAIAYGNSPDDGFEGEDVDIAVLPEPTVYYTGFDVYNVNYYDIFRNPVQAKELLLQALEVQPLAAGSVFDGTKDGRMVKVMPVNRIATRADLNDLLANIDHRAMDRLYQENPNRVVEKITLICMGHEPDLAAYLKQELHPYKVNVEVVDILRDRQDLQFKRDSEARVKVEGGELVIEAFYPMNLLQKLSMQKDAIDDWRELVESVMIDWNYDGAILTPALVDIPERNEMVSGTYIVPNDAGTIRVKITDLLSEAWEGTVIYG